VSSSGLGFELKMKEVMSGKCVSGKCWVQNVYDGNVGCKMYITEPAEHEK
jgi:hypothetical protein